MLTGVLSVPVLLSGCVERLLQIRSTPSEAEVLVDGEPVGRTPVDVEFHFYGDREIIVRKENYRELRVLQEVSAPWWQFFPFDLFTDLLLPWTVRDIRKLHFELKEAGETPYPEVRERADELRKQLDKRDP